MEYGGAVTGFMKENGMAILATIQLMTTLGNLKLVQRAGDIAHNAWQKVASLWRTADKSKEIAQENMLTQSKERSAAADKMDDG